MKTIRLRYIILTLLAIAAVAIGIPAYMYILNYNLSAVEPGVFYRSRQMSGPALKRYIEKLGIRTVLNMRGENPDADWYKAEVAACEKTGVAHLDFGWSRNSIPAPESLLRYLDALDTAEGPFLVHCQGGTHRAGFASAAFQLNRGRSAAEARQQFGPMFNDAPIGGVVTLYEGSSLPSANGSRPNTPAYTKNGAQNATPRNNRPRTPPKRTETLTRTGRIWFCRIKNFRQPNLTILRSCGKIYSHSVTRAVKAQYRQGRYS